MNHTETAIRRMLSELAFPETNLEVVTVHPSNAIGYRVVSRTLGYDRVWYLQERQWVSESWLVPELGNARRWAGVNAGSSPYTMAVAIIAELWEYSWANLSNVVAAERDVPEVSKDLGLAEMASRSCQVFLTKSIAQTLRGPAAGEPIRYARKLVMERQKMMILEEARTPTQAPATYQWAPPEKKGFSTGTVIGITAAVTTAILAVIALFVSLTVLRSVGGPEVGGVQPVSGTSIEFAETSLDDDDYVFCSDEKDCWAWKVIPTTDCRTVQLEFQLSSTEVGAAERIEYRKVWGWYDGSASQIELNLDPQPLEYATIAEALCLD